MMLELKNICKTYTQGKLDVPVLKDISLSVEEEEEYVAIMGPSRLCKDHTDEYYQLFGQPHLRGSISWRKDIAQNSDSKMSDVRLHSIGFVFPASTCSPSRAHKMLKLPLLYAGVRRRAAGDCPQGVGAGGPGDQVNFKPF